STTRLTATRIFIGNSGAGLPFAKRDVGSKARMGNFGLVRRSILEKTPPMSSPPRAERPQLYAGFWQRNAARGKKFRAQGPGAAGARKSPRFGGNAGLKLCEVTEAIRLPEWPRAANRHRRCA